MNEPTASVMIDAKGNTQIVFGNMEGAECLDIASGLEKALGADMRTVEYTPDFYKKGKPRAVVIRQGE